MPSRQLPQRWLRFLGVPVILLAVFSGAQRCQAQPTPSLEPLTAPAALAVVRAVHLSGDYKQAIRLYQQVQSQAPQSEAAIESLYRQGQAAFAAGDTATTIHSSLQLVIHPRAGRWQAPGLLLLGHAFERSGAEDAALAVYEQYEALEDNLDDFMAVRRANLLFELGRDDAGWEVLTEAYAELDAIPSRVGRMRVARAFGHRAEQVGRTREAAAALRTTLPDLHLLGLPVVTHIQALWRHVEREEAAGRRDLADEGRQELIREYPRSFQALQAVRTSGNRFPISDDDRTAIYYANGLWRDAIAAADDFLAGNPEPARRLRAAYYRALALLRSGQQAAGIGALDEIAARSPDSFWADRALWVAATTLLWNAPDEGIARLERLVAEYPQSQFRPEALYRLGRILTARGQESRGRWHLAAAADTAPESFYSLRARELTGNFQTTPPGPFETQRAITPDEQKQWQAWLVEQQGLDLAEQERQQAKAAADPRFRRAFALLAAGFTAAGDEELRDLADSVADEPAALVHLATTAHTEGHIRIAMQLGEQAFEGMEGVRLLEVPRVLQKLIYPLGFIGLVEPESRQRALDPLLLTALIRQESTFHPGATSYADARGLTQFMPGTARDMAAALGLIAFETDDLYQPDVAVKFGAHYLAGLLARFDNNAHLSLAGYNGGPGNVARWARGGAAGDMDRFVDQIDFSETRDFVQSVMMNYTLYRAIYQ